MNMRFVKLLLIISVLALLQLCVFRSFDNISHLHYGTIADWAFSGMGQPMSLCSKVMLDWGGYKAS